MTYHLTVPAGNGQYVRDVPDYAGYHQLIIGGALPLTGRLRIEYQPPGSSLWLQVVEAEQLNIAGPCIALAYGPVGAYRFTVTGVTGGGGELTVSVVSMEAWPGIGMPPGLFTGLRAITAQPYTEANVKNGLQFYARAAWPQATQIPAGQTRKLWFKTGAKKVIVKTREIHFTGEEFRVDIYAAPTGVTGGTDIAIKNYNAINPVATTCQGKQDVTTSSDGVLFDGPEWFFGATGTANRAGTTIPQGRERILPPETQFIVAFTTSTGTGNTRLQYFLDWYEGDPDLPR